MKKLLLAAALAAVAASPAFAAKNHHATATDLANEAYASAPNSDTVIDNGRVIGTDPDPFIRGQLQREGDQTLSNGQ